MYTIAV